ncbi:MAG: TatD family hydrolase [Actinobacteria bacterium]|nr:TatD family hydrolase [Actinomycetota bacterium]
MLVDSHAHLDMPEFADDLDKVLERAREAGVRSIITVGLDTESNRRAVSLAERYAEVFAAIGFHPHEAAKMKGTDLKEMEKLCGHEKVVAVGETGLDFYRNLSPREAQLHAFRMQLDLAERIGKPVVIHSRDAGKETMQVLKEWAAKQQGRKSLGVLHCFSQDLSAAREYVNMGFLISIAGPVTYPKSEKLAEVIRNLESDKILVETDCPFLAPAPHRGKRNEPSFVAFTAAKVAQLRDASTEALSTQTSRNAAKLFRLPKI